jgi:hypothetical protein
MKIGRVQRAGGRALCLFERNSVGHNQIRWNAVDPAFVVVKSSFCPPRPIHTTKALSNLEQTHTHRQ